MRTLPRILTLPAVVLLLLASPVGATLVDFQSITTGSCFGFPVGGSFTTQGFTFTPPATDKFSSCQGTRSDLGSNGTTSIFVDLVSTLNSTILVAESGGLAFSLIGFDASELWVSSVEATSVFVEGTLSGGGTVSTSFALDGIIDGPGGVADFQSFLLPGTFVDLLSVRFVGQGGSGAKRYLLDNVEMISVPEPSTALLLGSALASLAARRRRRAGPR